ncbi:MAG: TetR family transcriptional regulator [Pseudomonadota bacterium]
MQHRAISAEDKAVRFDALLDAAEKLWLAEPGQIPSVARIAEAAGVAKGTVYLYVRGKETLLLTLHERHLQCFFGQVAARAAMPGSMNIDDMLAILSRFLDETPAFLPLASLSHGLLERQIPLDTGFAFEERTHAGLASVVESLRPHFPGISQELMLQSYALILGLWPLLRPSPLKALIQERELGSVCALDYRNMLDTALRALWRGAFSQEGSS